MNRVKLDLNQDAFQALWLTLSAQDAEAVRTTLRKIARLTWPELYQDRGLRWEAIQTRTGPGAQRLYSLRITQKMRAVAYREGDFLRLLEIHPGHDATYQ